MNAEPKSLPHVMVWRNALRDSEVDQTAKLLGFVLSTYLTSEGLAGHNGRPAPSRETLARGVGVSIRTVDRRLDDLEAAGFLDIERAVGGQRKTNTYTATIPNGDTAVSPLEAENGDTAMTPLERQHSSVYGDTGDAPERRHG